MVRTTAWRACVGTLFCVLGGATPAQGQVPATGHRATGFGGADEYGAVRSAGVALYRGRALRYEVINGMAVHAGDIVLGTLKEVVAGNKRILAMKDATGSWPVRRDISPAEDKHLWPGGVIPYVIDPGFNEEGVQSVQAAIDEWNSKTVISMVERTTESDFVRFLPKGITASDGLCRANVGRVGGDQSIWLRGPEGCDVSATIHEIGHAVGLLHEHQRVDRDEYVAMSDRQAYGLLLLGDFYAANGPPGGPYDYASVMNYSGVLTIPPGILVSPNRLSAGDIDGVARMYGMAPTATTIATNPPGLEIIVDGERIAAPATFDWSPGSQHVVEAPSPQTVGHKRFVFGRWNDEASGRRTVTAGPGSTWFEANYIVQQRLLACTEAGEVKIRPESGDGYFAVGTPVEIEAVPGGGRAFERWISTASLFSLLRRWDSRIGWSSPGESSNPVIGAIGPWRGGEFAAGFSAEPLFRIDSKVDGIQILVNGERKRLPWAFPAGAYPNGITVEAPAIVPGDVRYRFGSWSDGERIHQLAIPATGGSVSLNMTREYRLRVNCREPTRISVSLPSEDGFYPEGTQVAVTAAPERGEYFAGWTGEVSGSDSALTVMMNAVQDLDAAFTRSKPLRPDEELEVSERSAFNSYEAGWHVLVPRDAAEMTVRFQASVAAEVDLYVRRGLEVRSGLADNVATSRIHDHTASTAQDANATITISRASTPPLRNAVYYIALGAQPTDRTIRGTLSVTIPA